VEASNKKVEALNKFLDAQYSAFGADKNTQGIEALTGKSIKDMDLGDIAAAKVQIEADPGAEGMRPIINQLEELKRAELSQAGAINAVSQARAKAAEANRAYLASLRDVLAGVERAKGAETALTSMLGGAKARAVNNVKAAQVNGFVDPTASEAQTRQIEIAGIDAQIETQKMLVEALKATVEALSGAERGQANALTGGDLASSNLFQLNDAVVKMADMEQKGQPISNNVKQAILARQEALMKENELDGLTGQKLDLQQQSRFTISERELRDLHNQVGDQVRSIARNAADTILEVNTTLEQVAEEIQQSQLDSAITASKSRLMQSLRGLQSPAMQLFDIVSSAINEIAGVMRDTAGKQRDLRKRMLDNARKGEDLDIQKRDTYNQLTDKIEDMSGVGSRTAFYGEKGKVSTNEFLKATGLVGAFSGSDYKPVQGPGGGLTKVDTKPMGESVALIGAAKAVSGAFSTTSSAALGLDSQFKSAKDSLAQVDQANMKLTLAYQQIGDMRIDGIMSKAVNDLRGVVYTIIDELRQLPIDIARFAMSVADFRQGPKEFTIEEQRQKDLKESSIGLAELQNTYDKQSRNIIGLAKVAGKDPEVMKELQGLLGNANLPSGVVAQFKSILDEVVSSVGQQVSPEQLTSLKALLDQAKPTQNDLASRNAAINAQAAGRQRDAQSDLAVRFGRPAQTKALAESRFIAGTGFGEALNARAEIETMMATQETRLRAVQEEARKAGADVGAITAQFMALDNIKLNALTESMKTVKMGLHEITKQGFQELGDSIYSVVDGSKTLGQAFQDIFKSLSKKIFDFGWKNLTDNLMLKFGQATGAAPKQNAALESMPNIPFANDIFTGKGNALGVTPINGALPVYLINGPGEAAKDAIKTGLVEGGKGGDQYVRSIPVPKLPPRGSYEAGASDLQYVLPPAPPSPASTPRTALPPAFEGIQPIPVPSVAAPLPVAVTNIPPLTPQVPALTTIPTAPAPAGFQAATTQGLPTISSLPYVPQTIGTLTSAINNRLSAIGGDPTNGALSAKELGLNTLEKLQTYLTQLQNPSTASEVGSSGVAGLILGAFGGTNAPVPVTIANTETLTGGVSQLASKFGLAGSADNLGLAGTASNLGLAGTARSQAGLLGGGGKAGIGGMVATMATPLLLSLLGRLFGRKRRENNMFALDSDYGQTGYKGFGHYEYQRRVDASFYNKREAGGYGDYKGSNNVKYLDSSIAGRYATGGLIGDVDKVPDKLSSLLQAEGPKGRVIVASVGERVLTADQNAVYEQAAASGALSLVGAESGLQQRFATGGVVGQSHRTLNQAGNNKPSEVPRGERMRTYSTEIHVHGVKDMDSFRKSSSELQAQQIRAQRAADRKLL